MTPMVDLGFLLISFFVITTELSKPTVMKVSLPIDGPPMPVGRSAAMTLLLDKNNTICFYYGDWKEAISSGAITRIPYSGINGLRNQIEQRQEWLALNSQGKEGRDGLMMIIKASAGASYKNLVDVLDEATITMVKKYTVVKISPEEAEWLEK
jgi:biopolymer transport protein ExbD